MKCVMHRTPGKRPVSAAQMSDEELLVSYRETGDRDLFTLLVQRYERELYSYLRRYWVMLKWLRMCFKQRS